MARELFEWRENIKSLTQKLSTAFQNLSPGVTFDQFGNPGFNLNIRKIEKQPDIETILEIPNTLSQQRNKRKPWFTSFTQVFILQPYG